MEPFHSELRALQSEEMKRSIPYTVIDLDSGQEVNTKAFDSLAKSLLPKQPRFMFGALQDGEQKLKYIVASSKDVGEGSSSHAKIYLFDGTIIDHAQFFNDFQITHGEQDLHAAGFLELSFDQSLAVTGRNLAGYSDSLRQFGLEKGASDTYKHAVLIPKLGNNFTAINREFAASSR